MDLATIYLQFHQELLRFIDSRVKNRHDAEDITQNIFIKMASNLHQLSHHEKLRGWIYAIARNAINDYYRANSNKRSVELDEQVLNDISNEDYFDSTKGLDCCLARFVDQLPGEYRDILMDVEFREIKQKDLADKYQLAYPTIRSRVQRGREKLREILLQCCHIQADNRGNILEVVSRNPCKK